MDKDPVQADEELYRAAEEVIKALAHYYALDEFLKRMAMERRKFGWDSVGYIEETWRVIYTLLERHVGLHVRGFHGQA